MFTIIHTSSVVYNMTDRDTGLASWYPRDLIMLIFSLCVTILSKIHQKCSRTCDIRRVVVPPVFAIIYMSSVGNKIINFDT